MLHRCEYHSFLIIHNRLCRVAIECLTGKDGIVKRASFFGKKLTPSLARGCFYIYIEAKSLSSPLSNYFIFLFFSFFPLFFRSTRIIKLTRSADH